LTSALIEVCDNFVNVSEDVMLEALQPTFEKARDVYCPEKTGDLRASGYLEKVGFRGQPRVEIGFARGGDPWYGLYVHEMTGYNHEPPTQAKFLQRAVMEDLNVIYQRLGAAYAEQMGFNG
jgi:hypothetical protein